MKKDIAIGAADTFDVDKVRNWVNSLKASGFDGDIWMITYRVTDALKQFLVEKGVNEYAVGHNYDGLPIVHATPGTPTQAHNLRFYHAWELLTRLGVSNYNHVIMTDVRDVIFQSNPSVYLTPLFVNSTGFIAPSEGIKFGNEGWNINNLASGFGQFYYELSGAAEWTVFNVGTLGGNARFMQHLFHLIFSMTQGRHYPADQSAFNILCNTVMVVQANEQDMTHNAWAAQMGVTNDPTRSHLWPLLHDARPTITPEGTVVNPQGVPFTLVHQYDLVPGLKEQINARYV